MLARVEGVATAPTDVERRPIELAELQNDPPTMRARSKAVKLLAVRSWRAGARCTMRVGIEAILSRTGDYAAELVTTVASLLGVSAGTIVHNCAIHDDPLML
jgi:hypothetical protein